MIPKNFTFLSMIIEEDDWLVVKPCHLCERERNSVTLTIIPMSLNFLTFFTNVRKQTVWQPHLAKVYLNYIQQNVWWKKNSSSFHRTWKFKSLLLPHWFGIHGVWGFLFWRCVRQTKLKAFTFLQPLRDQKDIFEKHKKLRTCRFLVWKKKLLYEQDFWLENRMGRIIFRVLRC